MKPEIDILIPTYNGEQFIKETINSALSQEDVNFSIIICDDKSNDETVNIIKKIADPRINLIVNRKRLGLVENWNNCVSLSNSPYITLLHQDDILEKNALKTKIDVLEKNPAVGFAFSNMVRIDASGNMIGGHWFNNLPRNSFIFKGIDFFKYILNNGNIVPCSSVIIRKRLLEEHGLFNKNLHYTPDMEMWLRLSLYNDVAYIAQPLIQIRVHKGQETTQYAGKDKEIKEIYKAINTVFTENQQNIPHRTELFELALSNLSEWDLYFLKNAARNLNFLDVLKLFILFLKLQTIK